MIVRCAWCHIHIRSTPGDEGMISDGICPKCDIEFRHQFLTDRTAENDSRELARYGIAVAAPVETITPPVTIALKPAHGLAEAVLIALPIWIAIGFVIWVVMR